MDIDWELVAKIVGGIGSAATALVTWYRSRTRLRAQLKIDIDILGALGAGHQKSGLIKARVAKNIEQIYGTPSADNRLRILSGLLGVLFVVGFIWWTVDIFRDEPTTGVSNWWTIATGYGAIVGLWMVFWSLGFYDQKDDGDEASQPDGDRPNNA